MRRSPCNPTKSCPTPPRRPAPARSRGNCAASSASPSRSTNSNADIARDLRLLVRERIVAGDSDAEVRDFVVDRYGEYVLFRPPFTAGNAVLWFSGPLLLLVGGGIAFAFIRRRAAAPAAPRPPLSAEEEARLREITGRPGQAAPPPDGSAPGDIRGVPRPDP